ncbi:anti-sigma factor [uncultured Roseobacter sp.]|uniref:anti-sigma factor family protein n=1 Tax=uncultured Roseobacter sp. TaxID=114847 RepID=UPI0026112753|nr:anti-sigma factor [uncultured Roseobacter sp.]
MNQYQEKLSAFLDGELSETETRAMEKALENDAELQAELETLMAADRVAKDEFAAILGEPVPFELAKAIQDAPEDIIANDPGAPRKGTGWLTAAAAVIALAIGSGGGYWAGLTQGNEVVAAPGWLQDIADYHTVYAAQKRHLVEVPATERDHIQTWLTNTVGADVRVPDLTAQGLEFQGARLLVAAGKPVAQLMYLDANERVVALCQIQTETPRDGFAEQSIQNFGMVSWGGENSNFVVVGDEGRSDLAEIARAAATQV